MQVLYSADTLLNFLVILAKLFGDQLLICTNSSKAAIDFDHVASFRADSTNSIQVINIVTKNALHSLFVPNVGHIELEK